ncbi:MAG: 50S ribosomal protein L28 [Bacilli bacterium]|nr:50S ribosomal protein L28 [Bacilli bacterium]
MANNKTDKKPLFGNRCSHAENKNRHAFGLNLQSIVINGKKYRLSAREIRSLKKKNAI